MEKLKEQIAKLENENLHLLNQVEEKSQNVINQKKEIEKLQSELSKKEEDSKMWYNLYKTHRDNEEELRAVIKGVSIALSKV